MAGRSLRDVAGKKKVFGDSEEHIFVQGQHVLAPWNGDMLIAVIEKLLASNYYLIRYLDGHERKIKGGELREAPEELETVESETVEITIEGGDDAPISEDTSVNVPAGNAADVDESNTSAHHAPILVENGKRMYRKRTNVMSLGGHMSVTAVKPKAKGKKKPSTMVNDALTYLEERQDWGSAVLYVCPPDVSVLTDEDSGDEEHVDDMQNNVMDQLNRNQLEAEFELVLTTGADEEERITDVVPDDEEIAQPQKTKEEKATERKLKAKEKVDAYRQQKEAKWEENYCFESNDLNEILSGFQWPPNEYMNLDILVGMSPTDLFELFFDNDVLTLICEQSNKYALEKGAVLWDELGIDELRCYMGIILLSGYNQLPGRKMYWEEAPDVHNSMVSDAMRRNRFLEIMRYIHFCDNGTLNTTDKCSKVRPLFEKVVANFQKYAMLTKCMNVDESMVEYFGKTGNALKQRMPQKPIRSGFKVWCLNLDDGYLYNCEVYQGKGSQSQYQATFGHGPDVVLGLLDDLPTGNFSIYIDNYFTSISLLHHLAEKGVGCTGTFSKNMLSQCPFPTDLEMKHLGRGSFKSYVQKDLNIQLTKWQDNKQVTVGSNFQCDSPPDDCQRWSTKVKERITVPRPKAIASYNQHMGGTDNMDQAISVYRPMMRIRKWYWPLFVYILQISVYNGWKLNRRLDPKKWSFLEFTGIL